MVEVQPWSGWDGPGSLVSIEVQGARLPGNPLLPFLEAAARDGPRDTWRLGWLALSCVQGPRNTLKGLYKVRSLGTATLRCLNLAHKNPAFHI